MLHLLHTVVFLPQVQVCKSASCEKKGLAEKAGEKIDNAVEKAGEKVEKAGNKIKEKTE